MACGVNGEYGENLLGHCMDFHHIELPGIRHQCICGAEFDGMQAFYLHFRRQHTQVVFVCRRCMQMFSIWHTARDHSKDCGGTPLLNSSL